MIHTLCLEWMNADMRDFETMIFAQQKKHDKIIAEIMREDEYESYNLLQRQNERAAH